MLHTTQSHEEPGPRAQWHGLTAREAIDRLETRREGLEDWQAAQRLARFGPNLLAPPPRPSPLRRFGRQFHDVLIHVLLAAAGLTLFIGEWLDAAVILGVVLVNAAIGFVQEGKAERALDAIRSMLSPSALVLRGGRRRTIAARDLVPGDVVFLHPGDRVPADLRLLEARNLRIDEAALTGESLPAEKALEPVEHAAELGDRRPMAFSGTLVTYGIGTGVVVATGERTELGRITVLLAQTEQLTTPLLRQMAQFGRALSVAIVVVAALTFAFGILVRGYPPVEMFLAAVSLAVAAIPEGLPAIMTITLALGVQRMAQRRAIIRRLPAVETLGAVTVICSDKTGTLTRNEMTVRTVVTADREFEVSGVGYAPDGGFLEDGRDVVPERDAPVLAEALRAAVLCNEAVVRECGDDWGPEGDPTEAALVTAGQKAGLLATELRERFPRRDVIPFESEHQYMASLHHDHEGRAFICLKGAPERVLEMCERERAEDGDRPLDHAAWRERLDRIAARGQRPLAVATRPAPDEALELHFDDVKSGFTFLAGFGLMDPPREAAIEAVARCRSAGIRVKMITGDHALTARAVARQLRLGEGDPPLTGQQISRLDEAGLREAARRTDVFARTTPEHKLRLVRALQADGEVVAMTGDGVNDAPALKRADIGIAMGIKGTEAAKEASEMVLADDHFATIADAVEEGRTIYDNLRKAILFVLPTNVGQATTVMAAVATGIPLPLTPVQVLWVNMVTAVTLALALAFEPTEEGTMARPPRPPEAPLLSGFLLWRIAFVSALLLVGAYGHFLWMEQLGHPVEQARSAAINTLVLGEVLYLFNSRFVLESSLSRRGLLGSRAVLVAIGVLVVLQGLFTYAPPLQQLFGTRPPDAAAWLRMVVFALALFLLVELEKWVMRRRAPAPPPGSAPLPPG